MEGLPLLKWQPQDVTDAAWIDSLAALATDLGSFRAPIRVTGYDPSRAGGELPPGHDSREDAAARAPSGEGRARTQSRRARPRLLGLRPDGPLGLGTQCETGPLGAPRAGAARRAHRLRERAYAMADERARVSLRAANRAGSNACHHRPPASRAVIRSWGRWAVIHSCAGGCAAYGAVSPATRATGLHAGSSDATVRVPPPYPQSRTSPTC